MFGPLFISLMVSASAPMPSPYLSMAELYKANREQNIPNYITLDYILTYYNLFERNAIVDIETTRVLPVFDNLTNRLYYQSLDLYLQRESRDSKHLLAFLAVLRKLLHPQVAIPKPVKDLVEAELNLIQAHSGMNRSPIFLTKEDFSQYIPRGFYTQSDRLKSYFLARMYASRMKFYLVPSKATGVTHDIANLHLHMALNLATMISNDPALDSLYQELVAYQKIMAGPPDDLTLSEVAQFASLPTEQARKRIMDYAKSHKRYPLIVSEYVDKNRLEAGKTVYDVILGIKFLGQSTLPDAFLFQNLVYDRVTAYKGKGKPFTLSVINNRPVRGFPRGYDLLRALNLQCPYPREDSNYVNYSEAFSSALPTFYHLLRNNSWYASDLLTIKLMGNQCAVKPLATSELGFWVQSRFNFLLYSKQSYTVTEKGVSLFEDKRNTAYLDPAIPVYSFLAEKVKAVRSRTSTGFTEKADEFEKILNRLIRISYTELMGMELSREDVKFLNNLDVDLNRLFGHDSPVIVDVHTEAQNKLVLQVGTGKPFITNHNGCRGALYSVYEFKSPMSKRMTVSEWIKQMDRYRPLPHD